jgi:hypothetical protein
MDRGHYWAIGIGQQAALTNMSARSVAGLTVHDLIPRICETKFIAEKTPGVGNDTVLFVLTPTLDIRLISSVYIAQFRQLWEHERKRPSSDAAIEIAKQALLYATP